jgi:hypothetical protein
MGNGGVYLYIGALWVFGEPKTHHTLLLTGGSVLVQSKGMKTIYINSIETMEGQIFKYIFLISLRYLNFAKKEKKIIAN